METISGVVERIFHEESGRILASLIAGSQSETVEAAIPEVLPKLQGAFSLVLMDNQTLFGARDPHGLRPLVLDQMGRVPALRHLVMACQDR